MSYLQNNMTFKERLKKAQNKQDRFYEFYILIKELHEKSIRPIVPFEKSSMPVNRLFCYKTPEKTNYFSSEESLLEYLKTHPYNLNNIYLLDYIGHFGNKIDVLRIVNKKYTKIITDLNHRFYYEYNIIESKFKNEHCWTKENGNIHDIIKEFKNVGQKFEQEEIDRKNLNILNLMEIYNTRKK